jgi:hypothetical protein
MSEYAANAPTCEEWQRANSPEGCTDPIDYWPGWFGDTPAYAPWAAAIDAKLTERLEQSQGAPVSAVGRFKLPEDGESFMAFEAV